MAPGNSEFDNEITLGITILNLFHVENPAIILNHTAYPNHPTIQCSSDENLQTFNYNISKLILNIICNQINNCSLIWSLVTSKTFSRQNSDYSMITVKKIVQYKQLRTKN